jgi:hypothetical protein
MKVSRIFLTVFLAASLPGMANAEPATKIPIKYGYYVDVGEPCLNPPSGNVVSYCKPGKSPQLDWAKPGSCEFKKVKKNIFEVSCFTLSVQSEDGSIPTFDSTLRVISSKKFSYADSVKRWCGSKTTDLWPDGGVLFNTFGECVQ